MWVVSVITVYMVIRIIRVIRVIRIIRVIRVTTTDGCLLRQCERICGLGIAIKS